MSTLTLTLSNPSISHRPNNNDFAGLRIEIIKSQFKNQYVLNVFEYMYDGHGESPHDWIAIILGNVVWKDTIKITYKRKEKTTTYCVHFSNIKKGGKKKAKKTCYFRHNFEKRTLGFISKRDY